MAVADPVPRMVAEPGGDDHRLVAAVRRGEERAFELLYERYHRRIHAYVMGMVKDHGRAEDITQEVFVSALRRMRETERPIAFKPWLYEIAKNACIDQFRRSRRAQEVSLQADEGLHPGDYGKLVGSEPTPDAAVAAKQDLDNLRGAFGGLSDTHHEILVLRELEGLSYHDIGERLGMSRPAVESTLFRARRRLSEEYDDLATGARCLRVQGLIETAASSRLGTREERRLSRHVAHCQPCRREALAAGLDESILTHVPLPRRAARKIAGLLPFPLLGRSRGDGPGWASNLPMLSDQIAGGWGKLATAAAVVVAGVGASGVGTHFAGSVPDREIPAVQERAATAPQKAAAAKAKPSSAAPATGVRRKKTEPRPPKRARAGDNPRDPGTASTVTGAATPAANTGGGGVQPAGGTGGTPPSAGVPAVPEEATRPVRETVETVGRTTQPVTETVEETVDDAGETVGGTVPPVEETVDDVTGAVPPVQETVDDVVDTVEDTAGTDLPLP